MGAAAIAARRNGAAVPAARLPAASLEPGCPLLAVCGLVGGAGTSTLAYLIARHAARRSEGAVLLAELADHGALAALCGVGSEHGLAGLARAVDTGAPVRAACVDAPGGLRLVAAKRPDAESATPLAAAAFERVLCDARAAHGLVVIDAGPALGPHVSPLLAHASQALLVTSETPRALARAEQLVSTGSVPGLPAARSVLVVIATGRGRVTDHRRPRKLAERHCDRLLLIPHVAALADSQVELTAPELESVYASFDVLLRGRR
jgi:Flp pilus assembly CpaE family ATPase